MWIELPGGSPQDLYMASQGGALAADDIDFEVEIVPESTQYRNSVWVTDHVRRVKIYAEVTAAVSSSFYARNQGVSVPAVGDVAALLNSDTDDCT